MLKDKLSELLKKLYTRDKKLFILIIACVVAVMLIFLSEPKQSKSTATKDEYEVINEAEYERELEKRLTDIISNMQGAGKTEVMVKTESAESREYLRNKKAEGSADGSQRNEYEYVIIDNGNNEECVPVRTTYPVITGVIVVCQGGENSKVKNEVTNAVASLLGISTYNISVLPMKQTEG